MPETSSSHEQHINPVNFPDNRTSQHQKVFQQEPLHQDQDQPRAQNFSFSSSYPFAPSRHYQENGLNLNHNYNVQRYQSPYSTFQQHLGSNAFSLLQPDANSSNYTPKPNQAIVRPIRRTELPAAEEQHQQHQQQQSEHGAERAAAGASTGAAPLTTRAFFSRSSQEVRSFADELSQKLRFLAPEETYGSDAWMRARNNSGTEEALMQRPRFETTVPTGIFLPPPNELQLLPASMLRRHVYAYSSYPMVLHNYYNNSHSNSNSNINNISVSGKDKREPMPAADKELKVTATRLNGVRATAAVAAAAAASSSAASTATTTATASTAQSQATVLAGGLHITKAQFQQQLQQRRAGGGGGGGGGHKRPVIPPPEPYKNMMYDRRVIKGSNFATSTLITEVDPFDKAAELRRRNLLRKRSMQCRNQRNVLGTPPPVKGRKHETIQTEKYLEKLVQRPPEFSIDTQTDLFLEKPPTPIFVPAKVGIDVGTEIGDGELFHFDAEAQPIIDVLVDACIEQSMLEVAHEMELDALRRKQEEFLAQREAELAELRRLEAEELRLQAEKERRLRQDSIAKELDEEMQKSVTAAKLLQGHIASLLPEVLENIEPASDAVKKDQLMKSICPWLSAEVAEEVGHIVDSREILTAIIQEIIKQRAEIYIGYREEEPEEPLVSDICEEEGCMIDEMEACTCETETDLEACPEPPPEPPHL